MKYDTRDGDAGLKALNEALALYRRIDDRVGQANVYLGVGIRLAQNGNLQEAEPLIAQALELWEQIASDHPFTAHIKTVLEQIRNSLNG